ncbi:MAG TPA: sugar-binding protein [Paludibacter sp.]|nr:sugar-binding protein [Paludibacter sp.]
MKKALLILSAATCCLFANAQSKTLVVNKLSTAPTIDGAFTDWSTNWVDIAEVRANNTTSDCTAQFQLGYTNDSLYVAVKVSDATPHNETENGVWLRDCVELFIHMGLADETIAGGSTQYRLQRDNSEQNHPGANNFNGVSVDGAEGYTQEYAIAWSDIAAIEASTFTFTNIDAVPQIRFEIQIADNSDGTANRSEQLFWNAATDTQYGSMVDMGYLTLAGTNGVSNVYKNSADICFSANKNTLTVSGYVGELKVYNVQGKLVFSTRVNSVNEPISLGAINKGLYLVSGTGFSAKFVK